MKYFLDVEIAQSKKGIFLSQRHYTLFLLEDMGFLDCKLAALPMDPNLKINATDGELLPDDSQYMSKPWTPHLDALHHLLWYLKAAPGQGLLFSANSSLSLKAYVDPDWGVVLTPDEAPLVIVYSWEIIWSHGSQRDNIRSL